MSNTITQLHNRITSVQNFISLVHQMKRKPIKDWDWDYTVNYQKHIQPKFLELYEDVSNYYPQKNIIEYLTEFKNK
jgi:hypothetical protein